MTIWLLISVLLNPMQSMIHGSSVISNSVIDGVLESSQRVILQFIVYKSFCLNTNIIYGHVNCNFKNEITGRYRMY